MANTTGYKGPHQKPFRDALRMEINAAGENHKALRRVAAALLQRAYENDVSAIREIADRLDGKVPQSIGGSDELPPIQTEELTDEQRARALSQFLAKNKGSAEINNPTPVSNGATPNGQGNKSQP